MKRLVHVATIPGALALVTASLAAPRAASAEDTSMCTTINTTPVVGCFEWVTGPASADNSTVTKKYWNGTAWVDGTLWTTDQGWPVTNPAGTSLELMVYGDTQVHNPDYWPEIDCIDECVASDPATVCATGAGGSDVFCPYYFGREPPSEYYRVCLYLCAPYEGVNAFYDWTNAVFYTAQVNTAKGHHIALGTNLDNKHVVNTVWEEDHTGCSGIDFTGVYTGDYFYACPGSLNTCTDTAKKLYFVTGTTTWGVDASTNACAREVLETDGAGIYEFDTLAKKAYASVHGCRVAFAPNPPTGGRAWNPFCLGWPSVSLQPTHVHELPPPGPPLEVAKTANAAVLWGYGSRFNKAVVLRGFLDYKDPAAYPRTPSGTRYVYFLGGGERSKTWVAGVPGVPAHWDETGLMYVARVPANETAIKSGAFQYFHGLTGTPPNQISTWGDYAGAVPVHDLSAYSGSHLASVIKKNGTYYLAVTLTSDEMGVRFHGMLVLHSTDGFSWTGADYVEYSDITNTIWPSVDLPASAWLVYGHYWVPSVVFNDPNRIPYLFSVWKSYEGHFDDFFFEDDGRTFPIPDAEKFRNYNTKMHWYELP